MPIVHVLTTSDLMRPIRIPTSAGRGAERPTMGSCIRCPIRPLCCRPSLQEPPRWSPGPQMEAKQNTLAQAGVRRNRLKNNTTRLSSAPDQAICNCWHKRTLAGYLRQLSHSQALHVLDKPAPQRNRATARRSDAPTRIGGNPRHWQHLSAASRRASRKYDFFSNVDLHSVDAGLVADLAPAECTALLVRTFLFLWYEPRRDATGHRDLHGLSD
jgi:hypothetical protein